MLGTAALFATASGVTAAADPASCRMVRFADVGWTDIAATTAVATTVLEGLGYKPTNTIASVPITFSGIKKKNIDVFLGYWNPSMTPMIEPFLKDGSIKVLEPGNLTGAKYTLAVPAYLAEAGLKDFSDIAKFRNELGGKIYGIEPGNDGNALIQKMIEKNEMGLGGFKLVESSEAGMLVEVQRAVRQKAPIVFLGWEPHPMNEKFKLAYLTGGDKYFGPNLGGATIYTAMWPGYADKCPNAAKLVSQLKFSLPMENQIMGLILDRVDPVAAAKDWLRKNPNVLDSWLTGVTTFEGGDGLPAVKSHLGVL
ncbi:glycine betaine/proline ABC transporter system, substrate-binding protein (plasmid) [Azoarcus sp. KH32C]|nr:choline ABC transporter substrate-binding protein [Azoarcus sp. KH32C]BAL27028.1 glycine betaine/proline ABC transporter system, substrate-binding protein [Azoarcus sp. KH32C]